MTQTDRFMRDSTSIRIPADFKYKDILLKGRPVHDRYDPFRIEHPPMPASRWAKIYAPFDALRGFNEAIQSKNIQYEERRIPDEDEQAQLNRKLRVLKDLVPNSRIARQNPVTVSVTYYKTAHMSHNTRMYIFTITRQPRTKKVYQRTEETYH